MVQAHHDELASVVDDRRAASLEKALETFNKIQGLKLSTRNNEKLNLERNPYTFS